MINWDSYSAEDIRVLIEKLSEITYNNVYDGQIAYASMCTKDQYNFYWTDSSTIFLSKVKKDLKLTNPDHFYSNNTVLYLMLGIPLCEIPLFLTSHSNMVKYLAKFRLERSI